MKITYFPGQTLTSEFMNDIQLPMRFDGATRLDKFSIDEDIELRWDINQRDGLLDWEFNATELSAPEDGNRLGTFVNSGRIYNEDGNSISPPSIVNNSFTVHSGLALDVNGEIVSWETEVITLDNLDDQYIYFDLIDNGILTEDPDKYGSEYYRKVYLYKLESNELIDIRQGLYIDSKTNFAANSIFAFRDATLVSSPMGGLEVKTSYTVDTTGGSFVLSLPEDPGTLQDGDSIEIIDVGGALSSNPITFVATSTTLEEEHELFTRDFGRVILSYSKTFNRWYPLGELLEPPVIPTPVVESHNLVTTSFQAEAGQVYYIDDSDIIMTLPPSGIAGDRVVVFVDQHNPLEVVLDPSSSDKLNNNNIGVTLYANNAFVLSPDGNWEIENQSAFTSFVNKILVDLDDGTTSFTTTSALNSVNEINVIYTGSMPGTYDDLNPLELTVDDSSLSPGDKITVNNLTGEHLKVDFVTDYLMSFTTKEETYLPMETAHFVLNIVNNVRVWTYGS